MSTDLLTAGALHAGGALDRAQVELELTGYEVAAVPGTSEDGGVLRSLDPRRPDKLVSDGVLALLVAAGRGPVALDLESPWSARDVAAVVLDGVAGLRVDGRPVTGPDAVEHLVPGLLDDQPHLAPAGVARDLGVRALRRGAGYRGEADLADVLYGHGRLPVGEHALRALPDRDAVRRWLGIDGAPTWLEPWSAHDPREVGWWHLWHLRGSSRTLDRSRPVPKLYVSPRPADLPDALRVLLVVAAELGVPAAKVGSDVHAVHRPDKLVAYAADEQQLDALAARLAVELEGMTAHGVPFTADRSADGLITWAADPALDDTGGVRQSWRQLVTGLAAEGLLRGRRAGLDARRATALARAWLWVHDVDPVGWAPVPS